MIQVSKFINGIDFKGTAILEDKLYLNFSNFEPDDKNIKQSNINVNNKLALINKMTNNHNNIQ